MPESVVEFLHLLLALVLPAPQRGCAAAVTRGRGCRRPREGAAGGGDSHVASSQASTRRKPASTRPHCAWLSPLPPQTEPLCRVTMALAASISSATRAATVAARTRRSSKGKVSPFPSAGRVAQVSGSLSSSSTAWARVMYSLRVAPLPLRLSQRYSTNGRSASGASGTLTKAAGRSPRLGASLARRQRRWMR